MRCCHLNCGLIILMRLMLNLRLSEAMMASMMGSSPLVVGF
jgi:hypothetical protein